MIKIFFYSTLVVLVSAGIAGKGKATYKVLNDGNKMPTIGLGTSFRASSKSDIVVKAVEAAITAGYRLIDTAEYYKNEEQVGKAIQNKIKDGTIKREDIFVITKLWNDHHRREQVVPALKDSLKRLGLNYVDLYLIHWPIEELPNEKLGDTDYVETWQGMEECKEKGLAKSIGVSNFNEKQLERVLQHGKIKPATNEIEVNPNLTQKKLVRFCKEHGIQVIAYSPLGSLPDAKNKKDSPPPRIDDPTLTAIGHKYNKNTVQVVLRYLVDRDIIPIPRSATPHRIQENIDIYDFCLAPEDIKKVDAFNKDYRVIDIPEWKSHKYYPF